MATRNPSLIELTAAISTANRLVLKFRNVRKKLLDMRPGAGLEDLLAHYGKAASLDIEVNDFYQFGTLYELHGATLAGDGRTVAAYWESTGPGRRYQFTLGSGRTDTVRFLVGATPRLPGAPVPAPFRSWAEDDGSLPTDIDPRIGEAKNVRRRAAR
jgi:hypothetical protein